MKLREDENKNTLRRVGKEMEDEDVAMPAIQLDGWVDRWMDG